MAEDAQPDEWCSCGKGWGTGRWKWEWKQPPLKWWHLSLCIPRNSSAHLPVVNTANSSLWHQESQNIIHIRPWVWQMSEGREMANDGHLREWWFPTTTRVVGTVPKAYSHLCSWKYRMNLDNDNAYYHKSMFGEHAFAGLAPWAYGDVLNQDKGFCLLFPGLLRFIDHTGPRLPHQDGSYNPHVCWPLQLFVSFFTSI